MDPNAETKEIQRLMAEGTREELIDYLAWRYRRTGTFMGNNISDKDAMKEAERHYEGLAHIEGG